MIKYQKKYFVTLLGTIIGLGFLGMSNAQTLTDTASGNVTPSGNGGNPQSESQTNSKAYDLLTEAQATAKASDEAADKTHTGKTDDFLKRIADNTYAFLKAFNVYSLNWLQIYSAPTSNELDSLFGKYIESSQTNFVTQLSLISNKDTSLYSIKDDKYLFATLPPAPSNNYATLVKQNAKNPQTGEPEKVPDDTINYAKQYVKIVSGINMPHISPTSMTAGKDINSINKYTNFYYTTNSIANYNAYLLSEHLADLQNNFKFTQLQMDLKSYASDIKWLTHVNEEQSIGVILRQLLLFTSQMYVVSMQSLETQKQLLASIAMTNSLIMLTNGDYEKRLYDAATK